MTKVVVRLTMREANTSTVGSIVRRMMLVYFVSVRALRLRLFLRLVRLLFILSYGRVSSIIIIGMF